MKPRLLTVLLATLAIYQGAQNLSFLWLVFGTLLMGLAARKSVWIR